MKNEVFLLKASEWQDMHWDGETGISTASLKESDIFEVDAATHRDGYREAYRKRHGVPPSEEKVQILPESKIIGHCVTFYLDENDYPIAGTSGIPFQLP